MSQTLTITAKDMLQAQGFEIDDATRANLKAKADRYREITGETGLTDISIRVNDFDGIGIGYLTYML